MKIPEKHCSISNKQSYFLGTKQAYVKPGTYTNKCLEFMITKRIFK